MHQPGSWQPAGKEPSELGSGQPVRRSPVIWSASYYLAPRAEFVLHYVSNSPRGFGDWRHSMELWAENGWSPVSEIAEVNVVNGVERELGPYPGRA